MPKTNAQRCKDYYGCNQAEKRKRAAERVRVHRLRRRMTSERSGTSACSPLSAVSNSDAGAATAGSSGRRASDASNGIGSNEVGDNTWTSPSPTPAQDCRGDAAARAAVRMRNSPRLCDRRATKKIPLTSAERTRRWRARKKLKCVGIRDKRSGEPTDSRWSPPPTNTRDLRGVANGRKETVRAAASSPLPVRCGISPAHFCVATTKDYN
ncbi:hypothetical protein EVAR_56587_1 [Eumeta japonica]|uniref:Uncharacterized protein n=1 Tax=Eumeta variegata TaxID=151549 RepID=A0A4C1Z267_EUMVA|nr:hypothetical protein EVAR_56587_1 [Eumeta japonica]